MDARWGEDLKDPIEEAIDEALNSIPARLRSAMSNVAIVVEDEPSDGQMLGLFSGVPLGPRELWLADSFFPAKISIFRGPINRLAGGNVDRLRSEVRQVVLQELAHYFKAE